MNAGHLPPLIFRAGGAFERVESAGGMALGMFEHATYAPAETTIAPGDTLVLYSDGITEAEDASGRPFDEAGLEATIAAHGDKAPDALGRVIIDVVRLHAGDTRLADDLTALVLKRAPSVPA